MIGTLHHFIDFASGATFHISWVSVLVTMSVLLVGVSAVVRRL